MSGPHRLSAALAGTSREVKRYEGESGFVGSTETDTGARRNPLERRISALDGIRGVAILLVLLHNAGATRGALAGPLLHVYAVVSNAGWIGVQMFFALSGFLITRILLESRGEPGALRSFYMRRLLRIAPLYYATLAIVFGIAPHVAAIAHLGATRGFGPIWYWLYLSNWIAPWGGTGGLPHVWSLAVEEQFYLFWPFLIAAVSDRGVAIAAGAMFVLAIVARAILYSVFPGPIASGAAYTFTVTRWDAIALGALVALALRAGRLRFSQRGVVLGLAACGVGLLGVLFVEHGISPEGAAADFATRPITSIGSALLVLACVIPERTGTGESTGWIPRLLASRPLAWVGKYSYAIYVFHMPVHLVLNARLDPWLMTGAGTVQLAKLMIYVVLVFAISAALALVSWHLLEQPMLSLKRYFPMPVGGRR